jgi:deoxyadenosine/deoxycytidine kinase
MTILPAPGRKLPTLHVEISGGIASGKTTLARRLNQIFGVASIEETVTEVPFWREFYRSQGTQFKFQKNLAFILFHAHHIVRAGALEQVAICDFAFYQDLAYVDQSPSDGDDLLRDIHNRLAISLNRPAVIVDLSCAPHLQLERIKLRIKEYPERAVENDITESFLRGLRQKIDTRRLAEEEYGIPFIDVDSGRSNFRDDDDEVKKIWRQIEAIIS